MKKVEILPQFIFKFECPDQDLISDVLYNLKNEDWRMNQYNLMTKNNRLEKNESYQILFEWFRKCIDEVKQELKLNVEELKITQSWANRSSLNNWHHTHTHSNSLISGIFYVTNSEACTWFSVDNIWSFGADKPYQMIQTYYSEDNSFHRVIHKEKTIAGNLIIFPSSLAHSVDEHTSSTNLRYTISFNTFPCGNLGVYNNASGLEIDIK